MQQQTTGKVANSITCLGHMISVCNGKKIIIRTQLSQTNRASDVKGIYNNSVTLKSRLTVTQGHWKRNH